MIGGVAFAPRLAVGGTAPPLPMPWTTSAPSPAATTRAADPTAPPATPVTSPPPPFVKGHISANTTKHVHTLVLRRGRRGFPTASSTAVGSTARWGPNRTASTRPYFAMLRTPEIDAHFIMPSTEALAL